MKPFVNEVVARGVFLRVSYHKAGSKREVSTPCQLPTGPLSQGGQGGGWARGAWGTGRPLGLWRCPQRRTQCREAMVPARHSGERAQSGRMEVEEMREVREVGR